MNTVRSSIVGVAIPIILACAPAGDGPTSPSASGRPSILEVAAENGVVALATGAAHRIRPLPDGELWVLTFNAKKRADGTVTGYAHVDRKDLDAAWDIDVTCMSVVGNIAWIAGIIRNARGALPRDGTVSYFYVIDNGEGGDAPPDQASAIRLNDREGQDREFCELRPLALPPTVIAHGNVQVH
jgi:hypothetical protein